MLKMGTSESTKKANTKLWMTLARPLIEIVVGKNTQENDAAGPVWNTGGRQLGGIEGNSVASIHTNTPGAGVVYYSLNVQSRMMRIGFQEGKSLGDLPHDDLLGLERLNVFEKLFAWNQLRHLSSLRLTRRASRLRRSHGLP